MAINTATKLNKQNSQAETVGIKDHVKTKRTKPQHLLKGAYKSGEGNFSKEKQLKRDSKELPRRCSRLFLNKTSKLKNKMSLISEESDLPPMCQSSAAQTQQSVLKNLLGDSDSATASAATLSSTTANKTKRLPAAPKGFGARALWEKLQNESMRKLLAMDEKIPVEWKRSYGAYIRDSINRNRPIIFRNFTQHEDVKDIDRLLDNSYQERVRKVRHHTNLMFRSSEQNKNRTDILLGRVGDNSNMLSAESHNPSESTMKRYFSNLKASKEGDNDSENEEVMKESGSQLSIAEKSEEGEEASQQHRPSANLLFLTEIESGAESGSFRDKFSGSSSALPTGCAMRQVTDVPGFSSKQPRQLPPTAPPLTMRHHHHLPPLPHTTQGGARGRKGSIDPKWQPLTLGALMDYSEKRRAHGQGRFRYGSVQHWHRSQASSV